MTEIARKEITKDNNTRFEVQGCTTEHFIDLGLCIECNNCEIGCAARHGHRRLNRQNYLEHSKKELIPCTCKQCFERSCVKACNFSAMRVDKVSGIVTVAENCVGCTLCVEACPYKAITMVERPGECALDVRDGKRRLWPSWFSKNKGELKVFANKCDLCIGYNDLACINQCPTGALRLRLIHRKENFKEEPEQIDEKGEELVTVTTVSNQEKASKKKCYLSDQKNCVKCSLCMKKCPVQAISMDPYPVINDACVGCGICIKLCPKKVLEMEAGETETNSQKQEKTSEEKIIKGNKTERVFENKFSISGEQKPLLTIHVDIKIDAGMNEDKLRGLLSVLKSELLEKEKA